MKPDGNRGWITYVQYQRSKGLENGKSVEERPEQAAAETPIKEEDGRAVGHDYTYI